MNRTITSARIPVYTAVLYLLCFQVFLLFPQYAWLCAGNAVVFLVITGFAFFTEQNKGRRLGFSGLLRKGTQVTFRAALIATCGAVMLGVINFYFTPLHRPGAFFAGTTTLSLTGWKELATILFTNALLVNLVCGGLASLFTAGLINERNFSSSGGPLPSVDLYAEELKQRQKRHAVKDDYEEEMETGWLRKKLSFNAAADALN